MVLLARNIARFVIVVLFQVLVMDNVMISGYMVPYVYVMVLLLLPFETPPWLQIATGFLLGLGIDFFEHTLGLHTAATVAMAYARPYFLNLMAPRDGYEAETYPRIHYYGFIWFLKYTFVLVALHHFLLFYLEVFQLQDFFGTLLRVVLSTILTASTIVLSQYFVFRK
ncbi:MAG: rod shape-determining protein MreD [Bacteroidales bacterium]